MAYILPGWNSIIPLSTTDSSVAPSVVELVVASMVACNVAASTSISFSQSLY